MLLNACSSDNNDNGNGTTQPEIQQLSNLPLTGGIADVWGYFDNARNREYAIVGFGIFVSGPDPNSGIHIVDVTDPQNPVLVTTITTVPGFDVKVFQNFLYTVSGNDFGQGSILDISDPTNPQVVGSFPTAHNITISDGYMYLEGPGLRIFNLNATPTNPNLVRTVNTSDGHDATVVVNTLYDFHGFSGFTNVYDVTDPENPDLLTSINPPFSIINFHHSGWPTEDGRFLFICNELATGSTADFTVWDISDLNNPTMVADFNDDTATVHNLVIIGNFAYTSYYNSGFRVFDVSNPREITVVDEFDTAPEPGGTFTGAFGVYPFAPSGNIYISDSLTGLHVFRFDPPTNSANNITAP